MKRSRIRSFTLVELLTVAAIIGIIAALVIVAYNGAYRGLMQSRTLAVMDQAALALAQFQRETGIYPGRGSGSLADSAHQNMLSFCLVSEANLPNVSELARQEHHLAQALLQCKPHVVTENSGYVTLVDAFGRGGDENEMSLSEARPIYYFYPYDGSGSNPTFDPAPATAYSGYVLFSAGLDGVWNTDDEIVYLSQGVNGFPSGFYLTTVKSNGECLLTDSDVESESLAR